MKPTRLEETSTTTTNGSKERIVSMVVRAAVRSHQRAMRVRRMNSPLGRMKVRHSKLRDHPSEKLKRASKSESERAEILTAIQVKVRVVRLTRGGGLIEVPPSCLRGK
jgi:hypothetical protein